jgi:hypothetical protein
MSKKNTSKDGSKKGTADSQPSDLKKDDLALEAAAKPAEEKIIKPDAPVVTPEPAPAKKEESKPLSGKVQIVSMLAADPTLPQAWCSSFCKRIDSAGSKDTERLRQDFRSKIIEVHDKSEEITAVFETERKDRREYRFLLSLAANTSGFDPKIREKLSDATLNGKREEFMEVMTSAIFKDQPNWEKIDQAISKLN